MGFRSVTKSVTLDDLERRNARVFYVISQNSVDFWGLLRKSGLKYIDYSVSKMLPEESSI